MAGSSARPRRWTTALALGLLGWCALAQTGCLHPPTTPAESFGQQLYAIQPGTPAAAPGTVAPGAVAPGPIAPGALDPYAPLGPPAAPALPGPAPVAPVSPVPQSVAAAAPNPAAESGLLLSPGVVVAPVGANVVMVAGVFGPGRFMLPSQRVEWTLAAGGVGQITAVGSAPGGFFGLGAAPAQKVNPLYAVNETFSRSVVVTHGTGTQLGDLTVVRGQTWISVSSPNEGASYLTALAPELENWVTRQQTAVIHWVDAQWSAAPPGVGPAGSRHTFTTTVTRRTTGEPLAGWHVRYEITGGPAAGFAPDGSRAVEVPTNDLGQASVEIVQPNPEPGANPVLIQVIRPAGIVPGGQRLVVGTAATEQSWAGSTIPPGPTAPTVPTVPAVPTGPHSATSPRPTMRMTGPAQASVGATVGYRIDVSNPGDQPATNVVVADPLPDGLTFQRSDPPTDAGAAPAGGASLQWTLGTLQPDESRAIRLDVRVDRAGTINQCASVRTGDTVTAQECVTTTVRASIIELRLTGPDKATVGQQARFELSIINHDAAPTTALKLRDRYDDGFVHIMSKQSPIEVEVKPLAAGEVRPINITFTVAKPGRLCHTVELIGADGAVQQTTQACLEAANPAAPPKPTVAVKITGPTSIHVGEDPVFVIEIRNTGDTPIAKLTVDDVDEPSLLATEATAGSTRLDERRLEWTIQNLGPGQVTRLNIKCHAAAVKARACNRAIVTDGGGLTQTEDACLEIVPAEVPAGGKLSLSIAALSNPIKVGGEASFVVTLNNAGPNPERNVALAVTLPEQMQYVERLVQNPTKVTAVEGQIVRFAPVAQLQANDHVTFKISVSAKSAGDATLHAEATSQTTTQPVTADTTVSIVAE